MSRYITTSVEIYAEDVIDQLDDDDLLEEVERRRLIEQTQPSPEDVQALLTEIYHRRRLGQDYDQLLGDYIWATLGRI